MKINQQSRILCILTIIFLGFSDPSYAIRCGTKLVSTGETRFEVRHKCGEPDFVESWEEERIQRDFRFSPEFDSDSRRYTGHRSPFLVKETVRIEEWTYNFGPTMFLRYLRFENGVLTDISSGDRGF
ncbi:MAG: DUF2845 domain-containing protein [Desulfosarcina sp.]